MAKSKTNSRPQVSAQLKQNNEIPSQNYGVWIGMAAILIVTYILYRPAIHHQFVNWDDQVYVEEQPYVLEKKYGDLWKTPISLNYHPLTMISLAIQAPNKGQKLTAAPFIHFNIVIHLINTFLVFLWISMITKRRSGVALFTAAVFALHPMHVESVAWVSERKDVLYAFFFLSACISYWQYKVREKTYWLILAILLFLCSILSKAMGVVFPLVVLLMDFWAGDNMTSPKTYLRHTGLFAISMFFGLMAVNVQAGGDFYGMLDLPVARSKAAVADFDTFSIGKRLGIASVGFVEYIRSFFWPFQISAFYPYPKDYRFTTTAFIIYPMISLGLISAAIWYLRKSKVAIFGLGFYAITVALVLQFLSVGIALMADRYTYLPYIGLAFGIAYLGSEWLEKTSATSKTSFIPAILSTIFLINLGIKTQKQVGVWQDSESLWSQVLKYHPTEDLALANRGNYRGKTGKIPEAIQDLEKAVADGCTRADVYEGLGNGYGTMSNQNPSQRAQYLTKAKAMFTKAIELDPTNSTILYNLGVSQTQSAPLEAIKYFQQALALSKQQEKDILPLIGMCQINSGQFDAAIVTLTDAIAKNIKTDAVYVYRGIAHQGAGKLDLAREDYQQATIINPNNQEAKTRLGEIEKFE
jgi:protein O-mannosyl-transferase